MSLSLTSILTAIQQNHKRDDREATARTGILLALQEIPKFHEFEISRTSVDLPISTDAGSVDLPDDVLKILEIRWINELLSYQLPLKNRELILRRFPNLDAIPSSYPVECYLEGTKIYIAPRTSLDAAIRVNYTILPSFNDSDDSSTISPAIPLVDKYLIEYGTGWVFQSLQMFNEAGFWMQRAGASLQASIDYDLRKPAEDRRIQPVGTVEPRVWDPLDPFNFNETSFPNYFSR